MILVTHDHRARAGCIGDDGESSDEGGDGRHRRRRRSGGGERRRSGGDAAMRRRRRGDEAAATRARRRRGGRRFSNRLLRRRRRPGRQQMRRRRRRRPLPTCRNTCACGLIMLGAHARELASDPRVCDPISRRRGREARAQACLNARLRGLSLGIGVRCAHTLRGDARRPDSQCRAPGACVWALHWLSCRNLCAARWRRCRGCASAMCVCVNLPLINVAGKFPE